MFYYVKEITLIVLITFMTACNLGMDRNKRLRKEGEALVQKIESYRKQQGKLPETLESLGMQERMEGPLYYEKKDSIRYQVWYGDDLGESVTYDSEQGKWE